jgi:hypothetical protein
MDKNTEYQNLWNTVKVMLRGKFITVDTCKKKKDLKSII